MDSWTTSFTIASAGAGASLASTGASTGASGSGSKRVGLRLRRFDGDAGWLPDGMMIDGAALPVAVRRLCSDVPRAGRGCAFAVNHSGRAGEHSGAERHSACPAPL